MTIASRLEGNHWINGNLGAESMTIPSGAVANTHIAAAAGIDASKQEHRFAESYSQPAADTSGDEEKAVHIVYGTAGTIISFEAGSAIACVGDGQITVDLRKNGSTNSLLSAAIVLDSNNTAYVAEAGTIGTPALVDGDVLHVLVSTAKTSGTVGKGVFARLLLNEDAA